MPDNFESMEAAFQSNGADAVFDLLIRKAREDRNHQVLFGARLMQVRHRLGLPLIESEPVLDVAGEQRQVYETAFRDAARETGELCLSSGDIVTAWPYFRAIGERAPVAAALEDVK